MDRKACTAYGRPSMCGESLQVSEYVVDVNAWNGRTVVTYFWKQTFLGAGYFILCPGANVPQYNLFPIYNRYQWDYYSLFF